MRVFKTITMFTLCEYNKKLKKKKPAASRLNLLDFPRCLPYAAEAMQILPAHGLQGNRLPDG